MIETFILIHNYEASLELILFKNSWWVPKELFAASNGRRCSLASNLTPQLPLLTTQCASNLV
jgi:hypothetical protein